MDKPESRAELPDALRRNKFSWIIENEIAGMSRPREGAFEALRAIGVRGLVSLTIDSVASEDDHDIARLHVPVGDFTPPTMKQMETILDFIRNNRPAAVHCLVGHGRTGTVLASYLVAEQGYEPGKAIERVRELRPGSLETVEQEVFVFQVAEKSGGQSG
jgi:atypical dual specificity phosphatase